MNNVVLTLTSAIVFFGAMSSGLCQSNNESKRFIEFFIGNCLQVLPDTKRVRAASRVMNWKVLQGDLAVMLAPADPEAIWEGWATEYEGSSYLIGISEGKVDGRTVVGCTVATREVNQEDLVKTLLSVINLRALNDETEAMQRYRGWLTEVNQHSILVNLTTQAGSRRSAASLSALVKLK